MTNIYICSLTTFVINNFLGFANNVDPDQTSHNTESDHDISKQKDVIQMTRLLPVQDKTPAQTKHSADMDTVTDYCKLSMPSGGDEGRYTDGLMLKMVHVFVRHGERTSDASYIGNNLKNYSCKFDTWYNGSNEKIRAFPERIDRVLHKQTKFKNVSYYPNQTTCSYYMLTSRGALQQMQLGRFLYKMYSKHPELFDKNRTITDQVKIKTTRYSRTFQSAIAFIYGFLPVLDKYELDLEFATDIHFCVSDFALNAKCKCPHSAHLYNCSERFRRAKSQVTLQPGIVRDQCLEFFINNKTKFSSPSAMADILLPVFCDNLNSETWKIACIASLGSMLDIKIRDGADSQLIFLRYSSIKMTPVLLEIVNSMQDRMANKETAKFVLYSGHDITLLPLLYVLGIYNGRRIPFASRVVIELYETRNTQYRSKRQTYLKFFYNGVDETENVVFCKDKTIGGFCSFELFTNFLTETILTRFGYTNYSDACFRQSDVCKFSR